VTTPVPLLVRMVSRGSTYTLSCGQCGERTGVPMRSWPVSSSRHSGWPRTGVFSYTCTYNFCVEMAARTQAKGLPLSAYNIGAFHYGWPERTGLVLHTNTLPTEHCIRQKPPGSGSIMDNITPALVG
jgi:hypothetical protein